MVADHLTRWEGSGAGNLQADAAASAEEKGRQMRAAIQEGNQQ